MDKFYSIYSWQVPFVTIIPYLYRYENKVFIDKFFESGELYVSCFQTYKNYSDNKLGDIEEGINVSFGNYTNQKSVAILSLAGFNSYCFCTSTILSKKLLEEFKRDSVFRIREPLLFMNEILKSLNRVITVLHGNCIYKKDRFFVTDVSFDLNIASVQTFDDLSKTTGPLLTFERYFLKGIEYQQQTEYRIIFETDRPVNDGILINCPEAIKYCEKLNVASL